MDYIDICIAIREKQEVHLLSLNLKYIYTLTQEQDKHR